MITKISIYETTPSDHKIFCTMELYEVARQLFFHTLKLYDKQFWSAKMISVYLIKSGSLRQKIGDDGFLFSI